MILTVPAVQLMILPLAADYEVKNIKVVVVDLDRSPYAMSLVSSITGSGYFKLIDYASSYKLAYDFIESDQGDIILEIRPSFEKNVVRERQAKLFIAVNAINGMKANLGAAYLSSIIQKFNGEIQMELHHSGESEYHSGIEIVSSNWFNPGLNYRIFMVPGILAVLVTMIGGFFTALNIVKEKEVGTIEQINVTPIRKHHFILGKLIPFWILGNVVFTIGLLISWLVYDITPAGSLLLLYSFIGVYLLCVLGLGLLVSTFCETQQQAMFIMFFFTMIFILMGGLFTSTDGMPAWAKMVSRANPVTYLIHVMRMVILKGSHLSDVMGHLLIVAGFAVVLNIWAVLNYKKTS